MHSVFACQPPGPPCILPRSERPAVKGKWVCEEPWEGMICLSPRIVRATVTNWAPKIDGIDSVSRLDLLKFSRLYMLRGKLHDIWMSVRRADAKACLDVHLKWHSLQHTWAGLCVGRNTRVLLNSLGETFLDTSGTLVFSWQIPSLHVGPECFEAA